MILHDGPGLAYPLEVPAAHPARAAAAHRTPRARRFVMHARAGLRLLASDPIAAARALQKALRIAPDAIEPRHFLALAYLAQGHAERALAQYDRLVAALPESATARTNKGFILLRLGRASMARAVLASVVDAHPLHRPAWAFLGLALEELGLVAEAEEAFLAGGFARPSSRLRAGRPPREERWPLPACVDGCEAASHRPVSMFLGLQRGGTRAPRIGARDGHAAPGTRAEASLRFVATLPAPGFTRDAALDVTPSTRAPVRTGRYRAR